MNVFTFDYICEDSQSFNHGDEFVLKEDMDEELSVRHEKVLKAIRMINHHISVVGNVNCGSLHSALEFLK